MSEREVGPENSRELLLRMIGAVGIVYGDIGTSVLYAMHESFFGHHLLEATRENVFGVLSFFFWSMILVVGVKYVLLIMRADNRGEGGIFALLALISTIKRRLGTTKLSFAWALILMGAALLLADGMITPAISVLSAVSGLEILTPAFSHYVVPITILILIALFCIQQFGTHKIGVVFGPLMLLWFLCIAVFSVPHIWRHPAILLSFNPLYALQFSMQHGWYTLLTLGSVVLCLTGAEALYADMGHFGRKPITLAWWILIFPALLLNYLGQGAVLLETRTGHTHLFYSVVPSWFIIPMIFVATIATIIASQALISGSFSLIQQAIALGIFPRQRIVHTNPNIHGQIYLPFVNWSLMAGCLGLVILFKTSGALAAAYGIAVTGTMAITTIGFYLVTRHLWRWQRWLAVLVCGVFLCIDLMFFSANLLKFMSGGYVPILIAIVLFSVMHTWYWGRQFISHFYQKARYWRMEELLEEKEKEDTILLDRSLVVLASRPISGLKDTIPPALQSRLNHLGAIYRHITILSVLQDPGRTEVTEPERYRIDTFEDNEWGSLVAIRIHYGFMEHPDLSFVLPQLVKDGAIHTPERRDGKRTFTILSGAERIIVTGASRLDSIRLWFFRLLLRNANTVLKYFNLESFADVSTEVVTLGENSDASA